MKTKEISPYLPILGLSPSTSMASKSLVKLLQHCNYILYEIWEGSPSHWIYVWVQGVSKMFLLLDAEVSSIRPLTLFNYFQYQNRYKKKNITNRHMHVYVFFSEFFIKYI